MPFVTFPQPLPENCRSCCSSPWPTTLSSAPLADFRLRRQNAPHVWTHPFGDAQLSPQTHRVPAPLPSCPSPLSQGFLLLVACPPPRPPPLFLSPSWLLHFFHRDPLGIYRQGNVTFHTGSLRALPCRQGWIQPLPNPSWLDISPPNLPLPFTLAKPRIPLSLPLSFSTPPAFSANPRRRILLRERAPWNHHCRPRCKSAEEEREKASAANLLRPRALRAGQWLQALGDSLSPFSRAWDLSSSSFRSSLFRLMVSPPFSLGWVAVAGMRAVCWNVLLQKKKKTKPKLFFFFLIRNLNTCPSLG